MPDSQTQTPPQPDDATAGIEPLVEAAAVDTLAAGEPAAAAPAEQPAEQAAVEGAATDSADAADTAAPAPAIPDLAPAACAASLAELFPALFTPGSPKPLKLRIQADIQARAPGIFNKKSLSIFLHRHTTSTAYLRAMVASPQRIDLDGEPAGELAEEHRQAATAELDRRRAMHEERRAAEREAQRKLYEEQRKQNDAKRKEQQAKWVRPAVPGAQQQQPRPQQQQPRSQPRSRPARPDAPRDQRHVGPRDGLELEHAQPAPPQSRVEEPPRQPSAEDTARRERQMLVRAYEGSTLTKANFCVLKGLTEAQLDAALAQAKQDPQPAAPEPRPDFRGARPSGPPRSGEPQRSPPSHRRNNRP